MEAKVVFILIFSIVYSTIVRSTATPQLITLPEMYEVRDGEAFELHHDSVRGQGKTKVNLERLEVVRNDLVSGLPFESCIEEKMARVNKYAVSDGHNSRFEEVHQVGAGGGGGGTAGNSWWRCADLISISNQKKSSSTLVFRPGLYELKSLLLTLERQQNDFLNAFLIPVSLSLSYLLNWNWNDKHVNTLPWHSRSSLQNNTSLQTKTGTIYIRFQTVMAKKTHTLWGGTYLDMAL